jgi:hypothetical protein
MSLSRASSDNFCNCGQAVKARLPGASGNLPVTGTVVEQPVRANRITRYRISSSNVYGLCRWLCQESLSNWCCAFSFVHDCDCNNFFYALKPLSPFSTCWAWWSQQFLTLSQDVLCDKCSQPFGSCRLFCHACWPFAKPQIPPHLARLWSKQHCHRGLWRWL